MFTAVSFNLCFTQTPVIAHTQILFLFFLGFEFVCKSEPTRTDQINRVIPVSQTKATLLSESR